MGRYYSGDIEGKFWFAVQSSDASERFGGQGYQPAYTEYQFEQDDLEDVELEIKAIEDGLGKFKDLFDNFFAQCGGGYNDEGLQEFFKKEGEEISLVGIKSHLSDYADLGLGIKIRDCIKEEGYCSFQAEH